ncbi:uncharacterized protein LOC121415813 [Lytechinus variegatus]|uniref:uncharacterized protein LOC121415813 n=1 Tax=Lytechinus variegatus TaxID=7654 RepID=UPI001BB2A6F9|nr:uncharacterized protein LOC121415813 [Lytechinus variegatus]
MNPLVSITSAFLLLIFSATSVWSQGLPVANCWLDAPEVVSEYINVDIVPQNVTGPGGRTSWNLFARVDWRRPAGLEPDDMYVLKLASFDGMMAGESVFSDPCLVGNEEILVSTEEHIFNNLSFGQLYELEIHLFRPGRQQKSLMGAITAFQTPECLQVTGDMDYCMNRVFVQYSGAPIDPHVNSLCRNSSTRLLRVSLSWLPPFQVNGNIFLYSIDYGVVVTPAPDVVVEPPSMSFLTLNIFPPTHANGTNQTDFRMSTMLQGLEEGKLYYVKITPIVDSPVDGGKYPGDEVELTFLTANWTDPMGETTEINLATPLCEFLDEPTLVPTENNTFTDNPTTETMTTSAPPPTITFDKTTWTAMSTATTPARLPPNSMEPAHIALIVIFSILIILVVVVFIVITIRMAKTGHVTKLPQLSQIPAMCKRQSHSDGAEKKKDLSMIEKGVKTVDEKKPKQTKSKANGTAKSSK